MRGFLTKSVPILIALVAVVVGLEAATRLLLPDQVAKWRAPVWSAGAHFVEPGTFENKDGYPAFRANRDIRHVAYYPDGNGRFTPEFDCRFRSDANGFVNNSIAYEKADRLVLGESFTVGVGGCDWIASLPDDLKQKTYFAAFGGHGPLHWRHVVRHLERTKRPERLLVVFITDDFFRSDWLFPEEQIACVDLTAKCGRVFNYPAVGNLADIAKQRAEASERAVGPRGRVTGFLQYHFVATTALAGNVTKFQSGNIDLFNRSVATIRELAGEYPVKLLWVNERREITGPTQQSALLQAALAGFDLTRCAIPANGFLPRDNHPNAVGYGYLRACVERLLADWS